jgi:hypothetical protein
VQRAVGFAEYCLEVASSARTFQKSRVSAAT